jgi:hypothetical protein
MAWLEGFGKLKIFNGLIGNQIHSLLACSTVPHPERILLVNGVGSTTVIISDTTSIIRVTSNPIQIITFN